MRMYAPEDIPKLVNSSYSTTIAHTTVDILLTSERMTDYTIHAKILLTAFVVFTFFCMLGWAPAVRRNSTTLWWPSKLAVHSGVAPSYSECVPVL